MVPDVPDALVERDAGAVVDRLELDALVRILHAFGPGAVVAVLQFLFSGGPKHEEHARTILVHRGS